MSKRDWEKIYREKGDLKFRVLPKVIRVARLFKERGYNKILDLCCGTGKHTIYLARKGFQLYATDVSPTGIKITKDKVKKYHLSNIFLQQHDMTSIPFNDEFFDAVICTWAIYHGMLRDIRNTINEIYRVLQTEGMVVTDFLTLASSSYRLGREIEKNTFIGEKESEEDVPHHYTNREEIKELFKAFNSLTIRMSTRYYGEEKGERNPSKRLNVLATK